MLRSMSVLTGKVSIVVALFCILDSVNYTGCYAPIFTGYTFKDFKTEKLLMRIIKCHFKSLFSSGVLPRYSQIKT